jgi:hypothetical protein
MAKEKIINCEACDKSGVVESPKGLPEACSACDGEGNQVVQGVDCNACGGTGIVTGKLEDAVTCTKCDGSGYLYPDARKKKQKPWEKITEMESVLRDTYEFMEDLLSDVHVVRDSSMGRWAVKLQDRIAKLRLPACKGMNKEEEEKEDAEQYLLTRFEDAVLLVCMQRNAHASLFEWARQQPGFDSYVIRAMYKSMGAVRALDIASLSEIFEEELEILNILQEVHSDE